MHVFVFGACLCRFRLCPGHVCVGSFCSGPCLCRFLVLWALCVNSFFVWALHVGFLLRLGVVRFTNITQTQKQPTQNKAQNRRVHAMSPKQKKSTERGPRHKRNLHKQSPEHKEFTQAGPRHKANLWALFVQIPCVPRPCICRFLLFWSSLFEWSLGLAMQREYVLPQAL